MKAALSPHNVTLGYVDDCVAPDLLKELSSIFGKSGFAPMRPVIEVHGAYGSCSAGQAPA